MAADTLPTAEQASAAHQALQDWCMDRCRGGPWKALEHLRVLDAYLKAAVGSEPAGIRAGDGKTAGCVPVGVLEEIFATLKRANTDGSICDTIWHGTAETLFDFIEVAIEQAALPPVTPSVHATIGKLLTEAMDTAVANGASSVSMPDEFVELALWLSGAPAASARDEDDQWTLDRAADLLGGYADHIKSVGADNLQYWPYLPEVEMVAEDLRKLAAAPAVSAPASGSPTIDRVDLRAIAERVGISMDLWDMGAASLAYSEGVHGVTREHLERFAARYGFACWNAALEANSPAAQGFISRAIGSLFQAPVTAQGAAE